MSTQEIINKLKLLRQPELEKFKQFIRSSNDFPPKKTKLVREFISFAQDKNGNDVYKTHVFATLLEIMDEIPNCGFNKPNFIAMLNGVTPDSGEIENILRVKQLEQIEKEGMENARRWVGERARMDARIEASSPNAKKEAEEREKKQAEERAKKEAEEKAKKQAEEKAKKQAEEKAKKEAEERAKKQAEEKARREAEARISQHNKDNKHTDIYHEDFKVFEGYYKKFCQASAKLLDEESLNKSFLSFIIEKKNQKYKTENGNLKKDGEEIDGSEFDKLLKGNGKIS